ncbi:TPA: TIGR02206 family membrane protein [Streptococcus suis]|nr:TIGR02206 family membrane protein [Streptococcus suis]HEL1583799.1 TIGR02206 family membrane protein [Streptococcus suis]
MKNFFTDQRIAQAPTLPLGVQILIFIGFALFVLLTFRNGQKKIFRQFFLYAQAIQLLIFNSWHLLVAFSWEYSLPLFHCRLAMWALLLLPDQNKLKQYFALMGLSGAILTFVYPVMDYYAFPHITAYNFVLSHILLFANSFIYLYKFYDEKRLNIQQITVYTFALNALLLLVNQVTGGNYGILRSTPFIADQPLLIRYLAVSICLTASMVIVDFGIRYLLFNSSVRAESSI